MLTVVVLPINFRSKPLVSPSRLIADKLASSSHLVSLDKHKLSQSPFHRLLPAVVLTNTGYKLIFLEIRENSSGQTKFQICFCFPLKHFASELIRSSWSWSFCCWNRFDSFPFQFWFHCSQSCRHSWFVFDSIWKSFIRFCGLKIYRFPSNGPHYPAD